MFSPLDVTKFLAIGF